MSLQEEPQNTLQNLERTLHQIMQSASALSSASQNLASALERVREIRNQNAARTAGALQRLAAGTQAVENSQAELGTLLGVWHSQKHKTRTLVRWRCRQVRQAIACQHREQLRRLEELDNQIQAGITSLAQGHDQQHTWWSECLAGDTSQAGLGKQMAAHLSAVLQFTQVHREILQRGGPASSLPSPPLPS